METMLPTLFKLDSFILVAIAIIIAALFWRTKKIEDFAFLSGFAILACIAILNNMFEFKTSYDSNMNIVEIGEPVISASMTVIFEILAYIVIGLGFLIKLYMTIKRKT